MRTVRDCCVLSKRTPFRIARLTDEFDRSNFSSHSDELNTYFHRQVTQDIRRGVTVCYVAIDDGQHIAGYYTLASAGVLLVDFPDEISKKLPRYPQIPTVLMGRLAVDRRFEKRGLGPALMADAFERCKGSGIGAYALFVDAKDDKAAAFYQHHGFIPLPRSPRRLFLPLPRPKGV